MSAPKTLLVRPPGVTVIDEKTYEGHDLELGILYVASYIEKLGHGVDVIDLSVCKDPEGKFLEKIRKSSPEVIGLTAYTPHIVEAHRYAELAKKHFNVTTVIGGIHASCLPYETLRDFPGFDFLVAGEGEETFEEFLSEFKGSGDYRRVKGLGYRDKGEIIINESRQPIKDLDALPYPAREKVDINAYIPIKGNYRTLPITTILSSRGCPYGCKYCSRGGSRTKQSLRTRSAADVVGEMKHCVEKYGIRDFRFVDDTLTVPKSRLKSICNLILSEKLKVHWSCYSRVDNVDDELLQLMKRSGCYNVNYGIEVGTDKILKLINKRTTLSQAEQAIQKTKKAGLETKASFMIGIPGETVEDIKETISFAIKLSPDFALFAIFVPLPGSEFYKEALEKGYLLKNSFDKLLDPLTPKMTNQIELSVLDKLLSEAYRRFYLRGSYILQRAVKFAKSPSLVEIQILAAGVKQVFGTLRKSI